MERHCTVHLQGAGELPAPQRVKLETAYAEALERIIGSAAAVAELLVSSAVATDCAGDGLHPVHGTEEVHRLHEAMQAAETAVWASAGKLPGVSFYVYS
jgi:hypothetical protein